MEALPSYTPEVLPGYDLTPATSISPSTHLSSPMSFLSRAQNDPNYVYHSDRMQLDLGARRWGTKLPAYGRGAEIQGTLQVKSFTHVERIVIRLIGKLGVSGVINQIPTLSQSYIIVHKAVEIWSAGAASSSTPPLEYPFSFSLKPDEYEFPPSTSIQLRRAQAHVAYAVRVDMYRKGIHMHERLQTEILHLPRTTTPYCRPFVPESGNEKRPQITPSEWHVAQLHLESTKTKAKLDTEIQKVPELLLPRDLLLPSGHTIPFILRSTGSELGEVDVQLVRVSSVQTRTGVVQQASTVSRGRIHPHSDGDRVRGELDTGGAEKEVSWGFDKAADVSYVIRVSAPSSSPGTVWKLTQGVTLTTHEWRGEMSAGLPALGSVVASRTAVNLMNMNI